MLIGWVGVFFTVMFLSECVFRYIIIKEVLNLARPQVNGTINEPYDKVKKVAGDKTANVSLWIQFDASGRQPQLKGYVKEPNADGRSDKNSKVLGEISLWLIGYKLVPA